ncbi:putative proline-rich receptor-like protein kinase PERK11 [Vitis vinifera]|uniref:Putative proline-rich receptor-like protein kinase PERK11 n=1 Tax=Vitis vinifera TaxID=29760 RepID=A0A438J2Z2_VITVI|nr:putative proline-rich receptor-like protein kinase PERK11 [Vitis vinifera]
MSIVNKGNAEKRKEKKRQVLYRIAMKKPYAEMLSCDFIEVAKLKHGLVAIQVCPDSDPVWKEMPSNCRDVCKSEQVNFLSPICEANSGGKALKRVSKHSSKRVPGTTAVLSIARKKITSRRRLRCHSAGPELELKSILYPKENKTGFRDVERTSNSESASVGGGGGALEDGFVSLVHEHGEAPLSTSSLCLKELQESTPGWPSSEQLFRENTENEDFGHASEYKGQVCLQQSMLGWPLLQKTASATPEAFRESKLANKLSVVQWAMKLPDRNQIGLGSNTIESTPLERETNDSEVNENNINSPAVSAKLPKELDLHKTNSSGCRWFSYEELKRATSQFSSENLIGEGGCSSVYKGHLPCGQPVAVKISKSYKEAWNNFSQEINITTSLNHKYIAPLIGICVEDSHLISVYDFVPKGSLEENLHGDRVLPWEVRFKVAVVVAEALNYLHDECSPPVIHRDIKSSNILLSDDFQPQLSDFGLAIMGPTDSTEILDSDVVGTFGYISPEYFMHGRVSDKIDIYSFGVVLLELLSGRRPINSKTLTEEASLVKWAKPILESGDLEALVDPNLDGKFDSVQMHRILKLLRGEKDGEEWFKMHVKELKERGKREDDEFDLQLISKPLLDVEDYITSHNCAAEQRKHFTLEEYLKG